MTDFQIFEDKYLVPMSLIILKIEKKNSTGREERELYMSVMDEASYGNKKGKAQTSTSEFLFPLVPIK